MLLPIKPVCEPGKTRADGTSLIFFRYNHNPTRSTLINTAVAIPPRYWNKKKECISPNLPVQYGEADRLNEEIERQFALVKEIIKWAVNNKVVDKGPFVKQVFTPQFRAEDLEKLNHPQQSVDIEENYLNIYYQLKQFIKDKTGKVSPSTLEIFATLGKHLKKFEEFRGKPITFESLNFDFYDRFTHFLAYNYVQDHFKKPIIGLKQNSISKDIKRLKEFVRDRAKRKIIKSINLADFKSPEEESDAIYLPFNEIAQIYYTDLTPFPELVADRNRFVLACLTGLRFSDFSKLQPEDVRDHRIYLRQEKSEGRVVIPLRKEAEEILIELFKGEISQVTNADFNENIKLIGKLAGLTQPITFSYRKGNQIIKETRSKAEWITSHTGRRSFCTNEFLAGTPVKLIMKISGHKTEKDFYRYIKITQEEAAIILEKLWMARNAMQPLILFKRESAA